LKIQLDLLNKRVRKELTSGCQRDSV
jgi:hypothetical protein